MMANIAQTVNVLQALILTEKEKMILTPTYHVFEMYKVHQGATLLPTESGAADYEVRDKKIPSIFASASKDKEGLIHVSLVNARPDHPVKLTVKLSGATPQKVTGRELTAEQIDAHNTFDQPEKVKPQPLKSAGVKDGRITLTLPAKSVTVLEFQ